MLPTIDHEMEQEYRLLHDAGYVPPPETERGNRGEVDQGGEYPLLTTWNSLHGYIWECRSKSSQPSATMTTPLSRESWTRGVVILMLWPTGRIDERIDNGQAGRQTGRDADHSFACIQDLRNSVRTYILERYCIE